MKITLNWLKDFLKIKELNEEEVADLLTMSGTEVKKSEDVGARFKDIVIGQVNEFSSHPNADKLSVCKVNVGDNILNIVCGASNFKKNDIVPVALPGSKVGDLKIRRSKIRGQVSEGMMCSEAELGLSSDSEGIMILDGNYKIGKSFAKSAGLDDVIMELEITPNRPDCLSIIGIARELSALKDIELNIPDYNYSLEKENNFNIEIKDYNLCPRYSAKIFSNVPRIESPQWLKNRLIFCDVRPSDLIVDLTNYVMLETGQPLHAFDKDLLHSDKIIVRRAKKGEKIRTIDDNNRDLNPEMLVIADEGKAVAIAGIMGGKQTEINQNTKNFLLESANFNGPSIMRTSKKLGLRSEASNRFEKQIDPYLTIFAIKRFQVLLERITGHKENAKIYDNFKKTKRNRNIVLRSSKIRQVLGEDIKVGVASEILSGLQIDNKVKGKNLEANIPSFRYEDLEREVDLVEEVARIYGFNKFGSEPPAAKQSMGGYSFYQKKIRQLRDSLRDIGLAEVINYSFISQENFDKFNLGEEEEFNKLVKIINPINEDFQYLRSILLPAMFKTLEDNVKYKTSDIAIFEVSKVFEKSGKKLPIEKNKLGILLSGRKEQKSWDNGVEYYDFYDLKGMLEYIVEKFYPNKDLKIKAKEYKFFHPTIGGLANIDGIDLGIIGKVHPSICRGLDIEQDVYYLEINLDNFIKNIKGFKNFMPIPRYPSIEMDIAIVVDINIKHDDIVQLIKESGTGILKNIRLFDVYQGKQIEEGKKSMAYSLTFRREDKTLKDREVEIEIKRILSNLSKKFNAKLRE